MAFPESSSSIFHPTPGKETEEAQCQLRRVGMKVWEPIQLCTDRVQLWA
jgi:hypothetical protein